MITAVDTNVLVDLLSGDRQYGPGAREAVRRARQEGRLIACDVVWAETAAAFGATDQAREALAALGVDYSAIDADAALDAGNAWRSYRRDGGGRERVIADFLIAAHARTHADRLLTRDRGFYRSRFEGLAVLEP